MSERAGPGPPGGPGESGPGEPGYEGQVNVGEEGASAEQEPRAGRPEEFEVTDDQVDDASADSFPASDPPAYSDPVDGLGTSEEDP